MTPVNHIPPSIDDVDASYLETLLGYNARRAALTVIEVFLRKMAPYDLRPVDFSVTSLIVHNPGITSRQICTALGLLPPNMVGLLNTLEKRGLIVRKPHPMDGRALGLHPTGDCVEMMQAAERTATEVEVQASAKLTTAEREMLLSLLRKVYR